VSKLTPSFDLFDIAHKLNPFVSLPLLPLPNTFFILLYKSFNHSYFKYFNITQIVKDNDDTQVGTTDFFFSFFF